MRTLTLAGIVLALAPSFFPPVAHADAIWAIAGKQVLRLHATVGGLSPEKRVEVLDQRVNEMLSKNSALAASDIEVREASGAFAVAVSGDILVTATARDAAAYHMTSEKLARMWLSAIRNTLPQLAPRINKRGA